MWIKYRAKVIVLIGIAVILAAAAIYQNTRPKEVTSFVPEFEQAQSWQTTEESTEKGIEIPGYSTISIPADTTDVQIELTNPEENEVYFQITFLIGEEQIYQSKLIRPGDHLYDITLDRALEAGEYELTIQYDTFSMDETYSPRNGATVNCILKVT